MANRAYLKCLQGRSDREIVVKYSIPSVWYDLFGPEDFHVGNECPIPGACGEATTTYFLVEAPTAVKRFRDRMTRAKIKLDKGSVTGRVLEWFQNHFSEGWLFSDVTELEWMSQEFISETRKQLQYAEKHVRRPALTENSLLLDLGWGTGISPEEVKDAIQRAKYNPFDVTKLQGRPYSMQDTYVVGDVVAHRNFGSGTVREVTESKMTVQFDIGEKTLVHRKK